MSFAPLSVNDPNNNNLILKNKNNKCLNSLPQRRIIKYFKKLSLNFGSQFVLLLACNYLFIKGVVYVFVQGVQLPYFKHLGVDGVQYQIFNIIALTPWAMKGIIGSISDSFALGGYYKRYYMLSCCLLGFIALTILASLPYHIAAKALWLPPILFFCAMFQVATLDLLIEGKYTELMRLKPDGNVNVVTFVWSCITIGSLVASGVVGPIVDHLGESNGSFSVYLGSGVGTYVIFWLTAPLTMVLVVPLCLGFLPEEHVGPSLANRIQISKIREKGSFFMVAIISALAAAILAFLGLLGYDSIQCGYAICASTLMIIVSFKAMPRQLAECNLYMYLQESLYIGLSGTLDFWYTANESCVKNGPHFDYTYYQTYSQLVGHGASIIGLVLFQSLMKNWKFRHVYWISTIFRIAASMFDFIILKRWNIMVGISDPMAYLLGDSIIMPITTMLNFMPGVILTAKLCPHSMESTVYAILAGFSNFGQNTAKSIGVFLQRAGKINTQPPNCNFDKLPTLIIIGHGILPLLCVPITFLLVPDARMSDTLTTTEEDAKIKPKEDREDSRRLPPGPLFTPLPLEMSSFSLSEEGGTTGSCTDEERGREPPLAKKQFNHSSDARVETPKVKRRPSFPQSWKVFGSTWRSVPTTDPASSADPTSNSQRSFLSWLPWPSRSRGRELAVSSTTSGTELQKSSSSSSASEADPTAGPLPPHQFGSTRSPHRLAPAPPSPPEIPLKTILWLNDEEVKENRKDLKGTWDNSNSRPSFRVLDLYYDPEKAEEGSGVQNMPI